MCNTILPFEDKDYRSSAFVCQASERLRLILVICSIHLKACSNAAGGVPLPLTTH